jgi:hypothetical protein
MSGASWQLPVFTAAFTGHCNWFLVSDEVRYESFGYHGATGNCEPSSLKQYFLPLEKAKPQDLSSSTKLNP